MSIVGGSIGSTGGALPGLDTSDATATAGDLAIDATGYVNGSKITGTGVYSPAMMQFDGSAGYYTDTPTTAGNLVTTVVRFSVDTFTGTATQKQIAQLNGVSARSRFSFAVRSSDWATADQQGKLLTYVANSAGATICLLFSNASVLDGLEHTLLFSFNGDTGAATFILDGVAQDDVADIFGVGLVFKFC